MVGERLLQIQSQIVRAFFLDTLADFAPNSRFIGEKQDNTDMHVKLIGSPTSEQLTTDPAEDVNPAFSSDGRTVAFSRSANSGAWDIYLLDLTEDLKPKGEPRRLTSLKGLNCG